MFKLAKFFIILVAVFFGYHCVDCLIDESRSSEHNAALYGLFCSTMLFCWGAFAPDIVK